MDTKIASIFICFQWLQCISASSWGYGLENGPLKWGKDYQMCDTGKMQSPIDFNPREATKIKGANASIQFSDNFWTSDAEGEIFNNGHTVEFKVNLSTNVFNFTGGPFGEETYQFLQLHFHWGSNSKKGSEHTIKGKRFPMEMHMVCINTKYINADGTLVGEYLENPDGVAVFGLMFKVVKRGVKKEQDALENVVDGIQMLTTEARSDEGDSIPIAVNLGNFIDQVAKGGYFTYQGSFTTPGCNEVVTWVNFRRLLKISKQQLKAYRLLNDGNEAPLVDNFRPVQPLNKRNVGMVKRGTWLVRP